MTHKTNEETGYLKAPDGLRIFYRIHRSAHEVSRIAIVHGRGEHSGRYRNVVNALLPRGISIWALDLRGHGKSEGKRGHIGSFDEYVSDVLSLVNIARENKKASSRLFLLGHSMGGLIVIYFALKYPHLVDALVISTPSLGLAMKVPFIKMILGRLMSSLFPSFTKGNGFDISMLSHDESVVRGYAEDPLVHDRVSARWFTEFLSAMEYVNCSAEELKTPILMQLAQDDRLTDPLVSEAFYEKMTVKDKTLQLYQGLYHEIYNEVEKKRKGPLEDLCSWLKSHTDDASH